MSDTRQAVPKLAFLHVPKCGGVSVETQLKKCFAPSDVAPFYFPHEYKDVRDRAALQAYSLIIGHFDHDVLELLRPGFIKAILFREPFAQAISLYNHAASRPRHTLHERIVRGDMPFAEFCKVAAKNTLSKYLLGRGNFAKIAGDRPLSVAARNVVELAKEHLNHFDCVGMLYEMERFHRLLSDKIGLNLDPFEKTNSSPQEIRIGSITREEWLAFEDANAFDLAVYEAVRDYYERSRRSSTKNLSSDQQEGMQ
jgi:hypothetical protein